MWITLSIFIVIVFGYDRPAVELSFVHTNIGSVGKLVCSALLGHALPRVNGVCHVIGVYVFCHSSWGLGRKGGRH